MTKLLLAIRWILVLPIWLYQKLISPIIPSRCIYSPTCSEYSKHAVLKHGLRGLLLGGARLLRCVGGLYTGGDDPVPDRFSFRYLFGSYRAFWRGKNP
jgi:putative membrane protein insertion efficiency factor